MEKKVNKANLKDIKNINIKMNNDGNIIEQLKNIYKKNLVKKHIILFFIMTIIFVSYFIYNINLYKTGSISIPDGIVTNSFWNMVKENFFICAVIIFAGITPYACISIIGIIQAALLVYDMILRYVYGSSTLPTLFVGGIIEIIGFSLCIAVGLYYCKLSTMKSKYNNFSSFSFNDIKKQLYELRKNKKKVDEIERKKEKKYKKIQEYNVKVPYGKFVLFGLISFIISFVGLLITRI